ncbi:MAG: DNA photolyase [Proteobacteria bacterium]|nr:MAG: DNA photolyase [Pseudomonadota bacterium]
MRAKLKQVLSVSRRTDIPAFYMPWFMEQVARGEITVVNPFNRRTRKVMISPDRFHTMVFWSKDFGPFLEGAYGEALQAMGYHLFFNFTINSPNSLLEPSVPALNQRLDQLMQLCRRFGSATVQWRFDPICRFRTRDHVTRDNLTDFQAIAAAAGECGVGLCISSFMDHYRKIPRRTGGRLTFLEVSMPERIDILTMMEGILAPLHIQLALCCEKKTLRALPDNTTVISADCISSPRIMAAHGGSISRRRDAGQRKAAGCGCTISVDVGSYSLHPCYHNCLFCYANPACDRI